MTPDNNLPPWSIRMALRAAQLVQDAPPGTAVHLTLYRMADGRVELVTPRTEVLRRPSATLAAHTLILDTNESSD